MIRWDHLGARDYAREQEERDGRWYADRMRLHSCPRCGQGYHGYEEEGHKAWEAARAAEKKQNTGGKPHE